MAGRTINGGMIYVGSGIPAANGFPTEPSLIDPHLPVQRRYADWEGETVTGWASYPELHPRARAAYLGWLAGGRKDENASTEYVMLFFYGLERRLLLDIGADAEHPDFEPIIVEIVRLLDTYGYDYRFSMYALALFEFLEKLIGMREDAGPLPWLPDERRSETPIAVQVGIGKHLAEDSKIPADWGLSYLFHHPEVDLPAAAYRCPEYFEELFAIRYRQRFPGGMKIRRPAGKIDMSYSPASPGFSDFYGKGPRGSIPSLAAGLVYGPHRKTVRVDTPDLPDIVWTERWVHKPIDKLRSVSRQCAGELGPYSRYVGRYPDRAHSVAGLSMLPDVLVDFHRNPVFDDLRARSAAVKAARQTTVMTLTEMLEDVNLSPGHTGKLTKREAASLTRLLTRFGVGMEPDVRFGGPIPRPGGAIALFALENGRPDSPSDGYTAALTHLHLAAVVAGANESEDLDQRSFALDTICGIHDLDGAERRRVEAHFDLRVRGGLGLYGLKRKVDAIPVEERAAVGDFLIALATVSGAASRPEITALEKLFGYLGLGKEAMYRRLHRRDMADPGPVTVRNGRSIKSWELPAHVVREKQPPTVTLDAEKVQDRIAETARVSDLLADIFVDEGPDEAVTPSTEAQTESKVEGLDGPHWRLLDVLASAEEWERRAVEELAASLGLPLLEGAFDMINEVAMDVCGEPVIEGTDPVVLNSYAVKELC